MATRIRLLQFVLNSGAAPPQRCGMPQIARIFTQVWPDISEPRALKFQQHAQKQCVYIQDKYVLTFENKQDQGYIQHHREGIPGFFARRNPAVFGRG